MDELTTSAAPESGWRERFTPPDADLLTEWMQGVGLRPSRDGREPFEIVLEDLATAYHLRDAEIDLARRAAELLTEYAEGKSRPGALRPEQFVYNLLQLCSGLTRSEQLWQPLLRLYQQAKAGKPLGEWAGKPFRVALRSALIVNQGGPDLREEWMNVLAGRTSVFGGRPWDAFWGVLRMPAREGRLDSPWMDAIGEALLHISRDLENEHREFRPWLEEAGKFWDGQPHWNYDLLQTALDHSWPKWAVWRLPALNLPSPSDSHHWFVWTFALECIPDEFEVSVMRSWPRVRILELKVSSGARNFLRRIAPAFERDRLRSPFEYDNSMRTVCNHVLKRLEALSSDNSEDKRILGKSRVQILIRIREVAGAGNEGLALH